MEQQGIEYQQKTLVATDVPADFVSYIEEHDYELVLLELRMKAESVTSHLLSPSIARSIENLERVFDWNSTNAKVVSHAMNDTRKALAVLIDKHSEYPEKIEKLLFIWNGSPSETFALDTIIEIIKHHPSIKITFLTTSDPTIFTDLTVDKTNINIITSNSINSRVFLRDSEDKPLPEDFDLIIAGADRKSKDIYKSDIIHFCPVPVLLLYNAC